MPDARTVTQMEAELLAKIASEIVEPGVIAPMEKIGWGHDQPPAIEIPPAETTSAAEAGKAPEPVAAAKVDNPPAIETKPVVTPTTVTDEIDWEALRGPDGTYLDGKYKNKQEAVKGVRHAVEMAKQALSRAALLEKEITDLRAKPITASAPIATTITETKVETLPEPNELDAVMNRIIEEGGTLDEKTGLELREAIDTHAKRIAKAAVNETLSERESKKNKENEKWLAVDEHMKVKYPESVKFTEEMTVFVQTQPILAAAVTALIATGKETEATELAWTQYKASVDAQTFASQRAADEVAEVKLEAGEQVRKEAVEAARKDAGVMTTMAGGVHEAPNAGTTQDEIDAAAAEMRRTGLGERYRALTFGRDLPDSIFGS